MVVFLRYWRKKYSSNCYVVIFFSFYILNSLQSNSNSSSNTVGVLAFGINVFWALPKVPFNLRLTARAKMSLGRAQNIFMPANINYIVSLSSSTCIKHKFNTSCKRFLTTPNFYKILPNLSLLYYLFQERYTHQPLERYPTWTLVGVFFFFFKKYQSFAGWKVVFTPLPTSRSRLVYKIGGRASIPSSSPPPSHFLPIISPFRCDSLTTKVVKAP